MPTAIRLCRSLEEAGNIDWFEEPVPPESYGALKQVREKVNAAISVGERAHTKWDFAPILENNLADYIMPDVTWTGGISEMKKIAILAEAHYVPISPHDAGGPINVLAGAHVMMTGAELLPARDVALEPERLQRADALPCSTTRTAASSSSASPASASK